MTLPAGRPARRRAPPVLRLDDVRGIIRLAVGGISGVTRIAEGLHASIERLAPPLGKLPERPARGLSGFVYRTVRATSSLAGRGLEAAVASVQERLPPPAGAAADESPQRLAMVSVLNGIIGDHLERSGNPLALPMSLVAPGSRGARIVVLVHGLCMNDLQWSRGGHDHGAALERALGWSPVYVRYNSGRHVSANGAELAGKLEDLLGHWPVPVDSIAIVGHSMGGLVARSAAHTAQAAGLAWPRKLRRMVFLGTPHHGAVLERGGNWLQEALELSPYVAPFARLGRLRSDGITDLRHGNLLQQDWQGGRHRHRDTRTPVPLPAGVECHAVAGALGGTRGDALVGDGLVSVASALGRHPRKARALRLPPSHTWVARGVGHFDLLGSPLVAEKLLGWFREDAVAGASTRSAQSPGAPEAQRGNV